MKKAKPAREILLERVYRFDRDHRENYTAILKLISQHSKKPIDEEEFRYQLGLIVYPYSNRGEYVERAEELEECIMTILGHLSDLESNISELDGLHAARIMKLWSSCSLWISFNSIDFQIDRCRHILMLLLIGIGAAVETERQPSGRSRPRLPYLLPAAELADLWVATTGLPVVAPKGSALAHKKATEATQPSTEFIRLGLSIINAKTTVANAMTLIRKLRSKPKSSHTYTEAFTLTSQMRKRVRLATSD